MASIFHITFSQAEPVGLPIMKMGPAGLQNGIILNHPYNHCKHVTEGHCLKFYINFRQLCVNIYLVQQKEEHSCAEVK